MAVPESDGRGKGDEGDPSRAAHVYANVMIPKDEETFVREDLAAGGREHWPIDFGDLEPHYENVRAMQAPQRFPSDVEPYASTGRRTRNDGDGIYRSQGGKELILGVTRSGTGYASTFDIGLA